MLSPCPCKSVVEIRGLQSHDNVCLIISSLFSTYNNLNNLLSQCLHVHPFVVLQYSIAMYKVKTCLCMCAFLSDILYYSAARVRACECMFNQLITLETVVSACDRTIPNLVGMCSDETRATDVIIISCSAALPALFPPPASGLERGRRPLLQSPCGYTDHLVTPLAC